MNTASTLEIYIDILFILNFIMDYIIFYLVSKFTNQKTSFKKIILGSTVASLLYCLATISPFLKSINIIFYLLFLPVIPIFIIFRPKNLRQYIQHFILSNVMAFVVGGINTSVIYWINGKNSDVISVYMLIISTLIAYIVIRVNKYYMQKRNTSIQELYDFEIQKNDKVVSLIGLLDTGNRVYDPITRNPVIIVEHKMIKSLLPDELNKIYEQTSIDISQYTNEASNIYLNYKVRLIPYHSLGNSNGMLLGFTPDNVKVYDPKKPKLYTDFSNIIIGIYPHKLVSNNTYNALLHNDII